MFLTVLYIGIQECEFLESAIPLMAEPCRAVALTFWISKQILDPNNWHLHAEAGRFPVFRFIDRSQAQAQCETVIGWTCCNGVTSAGNATAGFLNLLDIHNRIAIRHFFLALQNNIFIM